MKGAIFGDILGSPFEFSETKYDDCGLIELYDDEAHITDDTVLTIAVADWLLHDIRECYYDDEKLKKQLAQRFVKWTRWSSSWEMAYGLHYIEWFEQAETHQVFNPINSYGNGSAMRVSPIGWFFDTLEETLRFAKLSADVTHNHPEGEKGALCIATAVWLARKGRDKERIRSFLLRAFGYQSLMKTVAELRADCSWSCTCQDTVPMAVVAFLDSSDYESAVRNAISYGSDSDTIACMTGAIAEAFYHKGFLEHTNSFCKSRIPNEAWKICEKFFEEIE